MSAPRVMWLAVADGRGHLMRAHLMRQLLGRAGVRVDVVTTSPEGARFLEALGTPSQVLAPGFRIVYDAQQNLARRATERLILRYLLSPRRIQADLRSLQPLMEGADLVVNDFHPLLLALPMLGRDPYEGRVVHLYGQNLWGAFEEHLHGRAPELVDRLFRQRARRLRALAFGTVEHSLEVSPGTIERQGPRAVRLSPIVPALRAQPEEVRSRLGMGRDERLATVYLNPYFRDSHLGERLEHALLARGYRLHAVGEGMAGRPGWRPYEPNLAEITAASDLLVAAPGMGSLGQAGLFGVPYLAVCTDQPEQAQNLSQLDGCAVRGFQPAVDDDDALADSLVALEQLQPLRWDERPSPVLAVERLHASWIRALAGLISTSISQRPRLPQELAHAS
jgi:hypothetical protein